MNRYTHEKGILPCFPAGTKLRTPDGWKAIEDFRVGDEIVSRPGRLMTLRVRGRAIKTTHEHPWWVVGKGWVASNNLAAGDVFVTSEHAEVTLESVGDADRYVAVHNLTVEADHTYFVGDESWGFDVWSHNHTVHIVSVSKPPNNGRTGPPDSIYEQVRLDGGRSITWFDSNGRRFSRQDFGQYERHGGLPLDPVAGRCVPHEHESFYNSAGKPISGAFRQLDSNGSAIGPWIPE